MFYSNKYPKSVFRELQDFSYSKRTRTALFNSTKASEDFVQRLKLITKLPIHNGCVNCICWNERGTKILSGSDDQHLIITDPFTYKVLAQYRTNHRANIFSAKFLPNCGDAGIISCSGEGSILYTDLTRVEETQDCLFNCHAGTTYDVVTIPNDPNVFLSCGEDYTVRSFDLRVKNKCNKAKCKEDVIIQCRRAVTAITVNQFMPFQIAVGCADSTVRIYDRRMVDGVKSRLNPVEAFIAPGLERKAHRITSINFSPEGDDLLVSYSSEHVYLFGVRNTRDVIYSVDSVCGSDDEEGGMGVWCSSDKGDIVPVRRLRLRGDWSDTGPDARPHSNTPAAAAQGGRRVVQGGLIQRMTDVLSRMLNDPATRAALSHGGESEPSDQMQLEEGLGEYLDINARRRASEGNIEETSGTSETSRMVQSEHNSEDRPDQNDDNVGDRMVQNVNNVEDSIENSESSIERNNSSMDVVRPEDEEEEEENYNNSVNSGCTPCTTDNAKAVTSMECSIESSFQPAESHSPLSPNNSFETQHMDTDETPDEVSRNFEAPQIEEPITSTVNSVNSNPDAVYEEVRSPTPLEELSDLSAQVNSEPQPELHNVSSTPEEGVDQEGSTEQNDASAPSSSDPPASDQPDDDDVFPSTSSEGTALTDLTDELSTMFNGFKQKYGKKPMVNLVYSVRGSTASTISMTVEDQLINAAPNSRVRLGFMDEPVRVIRVPPRERREEVGSGPTTSAPSSSPAPASSSTTPPVPPSDSSQNPPVPSSTPPSPSSTPPTTTVPTLPESISPSQSPTPPETTSPSHPTIYTVTTSSTTTTPSLSPVTSTTTSSTSFSAPASTSSSDPSPGSSSTSTRFAVRMEKELCKAIRNARGEASQDESVKLKKAFIRMKYSGHRNARTMIKEATFWGSDYVMSGSDCGHVFIWTRETGRLVMTLQADNHVVNCLQPHPTLPILATSGIDYDLKLWAPLAPEPCFDHIATQELMNRNAIMLEETKDTITVPASFMIRMLACLNQLRRGGPRAMRRRRHLDE